ncbi:MAG: DUF1449 family protein [Polyangiaceae bacterium]
MTFLAVILSFPCVVFTVLLAVAVLYWLFVVVGALDMDSLDSAAGVDHSGLEGAAKGAMEGAAGAAKGIFGHAHGADGLDAVDGAHGAHAHGADGADVDAGDSPSTGLLGFLRLRSAPMTVVASLFALFGWLVTGTYGLTFGVPSLLVGAPLLLGSIVVSLLCTSVAVRPLAPLFATHHATKNNDLVGKVAIVSTGEVTDRFGQANLEDGGAGLILQVRCDPGHELRRGDRVLLIQWDAEKAAFHVERMPGDSDRPRLDAPPAERADTLDAAGVGPEGAATGETEGARRRS